MEQKARCVHCRTDVRVPESYADGDHIKCGACGTGHRVLRSETGLRLVLADVGPLRDNLRTNEQRLNNLAQDLREARASFGIGVNGLGIGVIYLLVKVAWEDKPLTQELCVTAGIIAVLVGILLEAANALFLQKRKAIVQISSEIERLETESRELRRRIREGTTR